MKFILATKNKGKIREFQECLNIPGLELLSLDDIGFNQEIIEDGKTFEENSIIKAQTVYNQFHIPVIADDSGLVIPALDGAPGIYSARYKGLDQARARRKEVLKDMEGKTDRQAYFYCSLVMIDDSGIHQFNGQIDGMIGDKEKGTNGFGYDPIFYIDKETSLAMISDEEKNRISHRGKATEKLKEYLHGIDNK